MCVSVISKKCSMSKLINIRKVEFIFLQIYLCNTLHNHLHRHRWRYHHVACIPPPRRTCRSLHLIHRKCYCRTSPMWTARRLCVSNDPIIYFSFTSQVYTVEYLLYSTSLTSFLSGDMCPIIVVKFRRFPFTFRRRFLNWSGSTIIIFLPQPSSIRNPMPAVIPSIDVNIKCDAAYEKRD